MGKGNRSLVYSALGNCLLSLDHVHGGTICSAFSGFLNGRWMPAVVLTALWSPICSLSIGVILRLRGTAYRPAPLQLREYFKLELKTMSGRCSINNIQQWNLCPKSGDIQFIAFYHWRADLRIWWGPWKYFLRNIHHGLFTMWITNMAYWDYRTNDTSYVS
jgi:hypothetical protein